MSAKELKDLLDHVDDTRELVLGPPEGPEAAARRVDGLRWAWRAAQSEATTAYGAWCAEPGAVAYAAYRAAEDRADAAQDALAAGAA